MTKRQRHDVDSAGVGFGTKVTYQGFGLVATGFYGNALGIRGQRATGAGGNGALMTLVLKENHMVDTYKVLTTSVKVLLLVTHMVVTVLKELVMTFKHVVL